MTTENLNKAIIQAEGINTEKDYIGKVHYDLLIARDLCLGVMNSSFIDNFTGSLTENFKSLEEAQKAAEEWALNNYSLLNSCITAIEHILDRATMQLDTLMIRME